MAEELGKIEKPLAENYRAGRKLYFVPLIYGAAESPEEFREKYNRYWNEVEDKISSLELSLGRVSRVYHELVAHGGEEGFKTVQMMHEKSAGVIKNRLDKGAELEALEESELLTEFMDWGRCLAIGLQSQKVFETAYQSYTELAQKRRKGIARRLADTLKADEIGLLFMREGHQIQFPEDVQVFYVAPPSLNEIERWLRDQENRPPQPDEAGKAEANKDEPSAAE